MNNQKEPKNPDFFTVFVWENMFLKNKIQAAIKSKNFSEKNSC